MLGPRVLNMRKISMVQVAIATKSAKRLMIASLERAMCLWRIIPPMLSYWEGGRGY